MIETGFMPKDNIGRVLSERATRSPYAGKVERARISRVLHDEVGQVISGVGLQLELLRMDSEDRAPETAARVEDIQRLLESALTPLKRLIRELDPVPWSAAGGQVDNRNR